MDVWYKKTIYFINISSISYIFFLIILVFNSAYYSILRGMALYKSFNVIK